jgi:ElaB/YqjD/DUF883 family membrane-anchored ribosome-binding protein
LASAKCNPIDDSLPAGYPIDGRRIEYDCYNQAARPNGRKDFSDSITEANALLQQAANETGKRASDLLSEVGAKLLAAIVLRGASGRGCRASHSGCEDTDDYVRGKPWQAIGVVAVVAFVVGALVSRR